MSLKLRRYFSEVTAASLVYAINPLGLNNSAGVPQPELVEVLVKAVSISQDDRLIQNGVRPKVIEYYRFEEQFKHFPLETRPTVSCVVMGFRSFVILVDKTGLPIPFSSDKEELERFMGDAKSKKNG